MPGARLPVLRSSRFTWSGTKDVASNETVLVTNVEVTRFRTLQVLMRLHQATWTNAAKISVVVRPSGPTDEDPAATFLPATTVPELARLSFAQGAASSTAPALVMSDVLLGFGTHVDLFLVVTQGTVDSENQAATISVDLLGQEDFVAPELKVMALLSTANLFTGPASQGPAWSGSGGACAIVFRKIIAGNLTKEWRVRRRTAAARGWRADIVPPSGGGNSRFLVGQYRTGPVEVTDAANATLQQNTFHRAVMLNENNTLKCYLDGVLISAGTALGVTYIAPTTDPLVIEGAVGAGDEIEILAVSIADASLTAPTVAAWDRMVKAGGSRRLPGALAHFEAADWLGGSNPWYDRVAALGLTVTGSPVVRTVPATQVVWA